MKKKNYFLLPLLLFFNSFIVFPQGEKGNIPYCAPLVKGHICYMDTVKVLGKSVSTLFNKINSWAQNTYGKDIFISNVLADKDNHSILITSKVELSLDEEKKTILKYRVKVECKENQYNIKMYKLSYFYDSNQGIHYKHYKAEKILTEKKKFKDLPDPQLFCNETFFFSERFFGDVYDAATQEND